VSEEPPAGTVIRTPDRRLRVFVSSTLGELADERRAVSRAITALRLTPVMFEQGARPHPPREVYRAYLAQSDVFIGLYWQRYGQAAPGMQVSGLEEELVLSRGLPRLLYIKAPAPGREPRLADLLARIRQEALVSYRGFRTPNELGRLVRDDLAVLLSDRFVAGPPAAAPAPARTAAAAPARSRGPRPLPVGSTSLVGREQAIGEVADLIEGAGARLVTLTGPGGVGKTRLAVAAGQRLRDRFGARTAFVPLAAVTDPGLVLAAVGRAVGADLAGTGPPADALAEQIGDGAWLLILDNLEQVTGAAPDLGELLADCPGVTILATSRTVLGLRAEQEYPVPPLPLPADSATAPEAELAASPAVALFVDRARAVRPGFTLIESNAAAVAEICRRLEGLPLAIELAAARTRLLDPATLLRRLTASLDALGTGAVDLPERQQTLRATVEWSVGLLDDAERSLLETMAVFVDGWTIEAAAQVAGLDEDRALELSEALARHSLIYLDDGGASPRSRMLETIRAFVAERLAGRPDAGEIGRRHAGYYRALAERSDRPLRGAGHDALLDRLQAEAGNLAAAVRWYLGNDPAPLPHLFRVLWSFWFLREHLPEARDWVDQLLPTADSLSPQARAELMWTAAVTANEVGDDAAALAARRNLEPLLDTIEDPFLRAVGLLALAWTSPITGDFDGARREASASLAQLRGQDEPFWTAQASADLGAVEMATGRYDDALSHLDEMRDLAERFGYPWLAAWSQVLMGTIAVAQGRLDQARDQLDEALEQGQSANITSSMALGVIAFARLALADGDPGRAALLAAAAEGLRRRAGLQVWPVLRRGEAELVAQIRQALEASAFDEKYAAGGRLSRREVVAAVRDQPGTRPA
jgi:predicted ATPase/predicted negative regulator of RcsB-dependent stress response